MTGRRGLFGNLLAAATFGRVGCQSDTPGKIDIDVSAVNSAKIASEMNNFVKNGLREDFDAAFASGRMQLSIDRVFFLAREPGETRETFEKRRLATYR